MTTSVQAVDFTSFVFASNDDIKTTSLLVAEKFGKLHKDVLRKIENLECSKDFTERNFTLCHKNNELQNGKPQPFYEMTKDGFMFLVMGFTGKAAAQIKEAYINAFNLMHAKLFPKHVPAPQTPSGLPELLSANLTPLKKIMMLTLASRTDENGQVQIGIHDLANICGIAKSTTCECVNGLEKTGFLTITKTYGVTGGSQPNIYTIPERFRVVSGELVNEEPISLEYMPPKGMVLVAENELESLRHKANAKASPVQKCDPIPTNSVIIPRSEYDAFKKLDGIVSGIRFSLNC